MARRRLSQQQQKRIRAAQSAFVECDSHRRGLVVSHRGGQILVELDDGSTTEAKIKSNLGPLVCGDRVSLEATAQNQNRVSAILPRDNLLRRVDGFNQERAVAANISQLVICLAVVPEPNLFLLDQYLLSAEQEAIEACILLNKIDLAADAEELLKLENVYRSLGYRLLRTSVRTGQGMQDFKHLLNRQTSVLSGVSGVGKSSLISWLLPDQEIKIGTISKTSAEGRHTTRTSHLYHLPGSGDLIDTPGVRGFSPYINHKRPLSEGFREIRELATACRFHNCQHRNEPSCAVIAAADAGTINPQRYQNYLKLLLQSAAD